MLQKPVVIFCRISGRITNLDIYVVIKIFHCIIGAVLNTAYQYLTYKLLSLFWVMLLFLVFRWQETHKIPTEIEGFSVSVCATSPQWWGERGNRLEAEEVSQYLSCCQSLAWGSLSQGNFCLAISDLWSSSSEVVEDKVSAPAGRKWSITILSWKSQMRYMWK